jgi:hypothetical protein
LDVVHSNSLTSRFAIHTSEHWRKGREAKAQTSLGRLNRPRLEGWLMGVNDPAANPETAPLPPEMVELGHLQPVDFGDALSGHAVTKNVKKVVRYMNNYTFDHDQQLQQWPALWPNLGEPPIASPNSCTAAYAFERHEA